MLKKCLFVAIVAMLAAAAQAGEFKTYDWPKTVPTPIPQELCHVTVTMDVGYWIQCVQETKNIKVSQVSIHEYAGCTTIDFKSNFNATLSATLEQTGSITFNSTTASSNPSVVTLTPSLLPQLATTNVQVCVTLKNVGLGAVVGGSKDQVVATIHIFVVPT